MPSVVISLTNIIAPLSQRYVMPETHHRQAPHAGDERERHTIAGLHGPHAGTDLLDHTGAFVATEKRIVVPRRHTGELHHRRKVRCGIHIARGEMVVGVADSGDCHLHQYLALAGGRA